MYLTAYVLGPADQADYNVSHYEARRQLETAHVAERQEVAEPAKDQGDVRGWFARLIPAAQR